VASGEFQIVERSRIRCGPRLCPSVHPRQNHRSGTRNCPPDAGRTKPDRAGPFTPTSHGCCQCDSRETAPHSVSWAEVFLPSIFLHSTRAHNLSVSIGVEGLR
jgi:hypothetical protein